jgi:hypothetical protein
LLVGVAGRWPSPESNRNLRFLDHRGGEVELSSLERKSKFPKRRGIRVRRDGSPIALCRKQAGISCGLRRMPAGGAVFPDLPTLTRRPNLRPDARRGVERELHRDRGAL